MILKRETFCQVQAKQSVVESISLLAGYLTVAFITLSEASGIILSDENCCRSLPH